jgi:serine phosphatase RsbU (regulator of sigma subunit)
VREPGRLTDVGRLLHAAEAASPVDAVDAVARELRTAFDAVAVSFLINDLSGRALVRLAHVPLADDHAGTADLAAGERRSAQESATVLPFDGGPLEQALRTQSVQVVPPGVQTRGGLEDWWRVLAPVTERGESIGVLELYLRSEPGGDDLADVAQVAHLLAFVIIANRRHTDLFEWGQRSRAFSLSAEMQQRLLPEARTCEAAAFTLAGWLEPAASIGGDTFDYSLARDVLHLSLTDAMGHGVGAALTASMCLAGLRGARREGLTLTDQAAATNEALASHSEVADREAFATGVLARVDLRSGNLEIVNAGHVPPYLLRDSTLTPLDLHVDMPLGMFPGTTFTSTRMDLRPGDRLIFLTDGMLERNVANLDIGHAILTTRDLHPRELVRSLADSALAAAGHALEDDATLLCLDWHGMHGDDRDSESGASLTRASDALEG